MSRIEKSSCHCPFCEGPLDPEESYCAPCGVKVDCCPQCGKPLPRGEMTCPECSSAKQSKPKGCCR